MGTLRKAIVLFGINLSASVYIGIGVFGSLVEMTPWLGPQQSLWSSLLFGAATLLCIRGIYYFGTMWDGILAREAAAKEMRVKVAALPTGLP